MTPSEVISLNCFRAFGLLDEDQQSSISVLSMLNQLSPEQLVNCTAEFFLEDTCFSVMLIVEAEYRFGFIRKIIHDSVQDGLNEEPPLEEVAPTLYSFIPLVTHERTRNYGIEQVIGEDKVRRRISDRLDEYSTLMWNSIETIEEVPQRNWSVPGIAREHPFEIYLGRVSDNIRESLVAGDVMLDPLLSSLLYQAASLKWQVHMQVASSSNATD